MVFPGLSNMKGYFAVWLPLSSIAASVFGKLPDAGRRQITGEQK
jgi:hypothetical protein